MKNMLVAIAMTTTLLLVGCSSGYDENKTTDIIHDSKTLIDGKLYYIAHDSEQPDFPKSYERFLNEHTNLKVIDIEADITEDTTTTSTAGYFIFTEQIK